MNQEFDDDLSTPTEADLTSCYGNKYLSAEEVGDRKIRTKIAKVWMDELQRPNGKSQKRFLLGFTTTKHWSSTRPIKPRSSTHSGRTLRIGSAPRSGS
jgi:hypothetical protein